MSMVNGVRVDATIPFVRGIIIKLKNIDIINEFAQNKLKKKRKTYRLNYSYDTKRVLKIFGDHGIIRHLNRITIDDIFVVARQMKVKYI